MYATPRGHFATRCRKPGRRTPVHCAADGRSAEPSPALALRLLDRGISRSNHLGQRYNEGGTHAETLHDVGTGRVVCPGVGCGGLRSRYLRLTRSIGARSTVWFAEFVSIDKAAGTLTAKARLRYDVIPEYEQFKPGNRFTLQWYTSAWGETDGIQHLARKEQLDGIGPYVMPAHSWRSIAPQRP